MIYRIEKPLDLKRLVYDSYSLSVNNKRCLISVSKVCNNEKGMWLFCLVD